VLTYIWCLIFFALYGEDDYLIPTMGAFIPWIFLAQTNAWLYFADNDGQWVQDIARLNKQVHHHNKELVATQEAAAKFDKEIRELTTKMVGEEDRRLVLKVYLANMEKIAEANSRRSIKK
jgi:septal ring factor EnvC (AmiA/AmiB activator)